MGPIQNLRATTSVRSNFLSILQEKTYFFYFTHPLLQNIHISLSILHIYSIKYSFFYIFYYFLTHGLSLSLRPNHRHHHPATIKPKPRSLKPKLCDFFVSHSHGWSEPKPRPIQAETQGWSERRLIRPIQAEVDADEEDQQGVNEKRRGWSDPLK